MGSVGLQVASGVRWLSILMLGIALGMPLGTAVPAHAQGKRKGQTRAAPPGASGSSVFADQQRELRTRMAAVVELQPIRRRFSEAATRAPRHDRQAGSRADRGVAQRSSSRHHAACSQASRSQATGSAHRSVSRAWATRFARSTAAAAKTGDGRVGTTVARRGDRWARAARRSRGRTTSS